MIIEFSLLLLLLISCSAITDSNYQNRHRRSLDHIVIPYWRQLQRNRKVMYQPYIRSPMSVVGFSDLQVPFSVRMKRTHFYDFDD